MRKVVYFATGSAEETAGELRRLRLRDSGVALRVVAPAENRRELQRLGSLDPDQVLPYSLSSAPFLWLRLWLFLGFAPGSEVVCLKAPGRFRVLKALALLLPGKLVLSDGKQAAARCNRFQLLWAVLIQAKGPICILGSAPPSQLKAIVASVRQRYPGARVHGILPPSFESTVDSWFESCDRMRGSSLSAYFLLAARCIGKGRFQRIILPWTGEDFAALKWVGWWLPLGSVEIYNEHLDVFSGRNVYSLIRHFLWRWRQEREARLRVLPVGVIGSASGFYLKKIIPAIRRRYPQAQIHGLLPEPLQASAQGLFDGTTMLRPGIGGLWQACKISQQPFQCWIVPWTDERYFRMKLLAALLPFRRRNIYNELADGFPLRQFVTVCRHVAWRARDHLSFQIVSGARGSNLLSRFGHLILYALRLIAAAPLLWQARLRSWFLQSNPGSGAWIGRRRENEPVDLIYFEMDGAGAGDAAPPDWIRAEKRMRLALKVMGTDEIAGVVARINAAVRGSKAEYICLLDSRCKIADEDWLGRLLGAFDDRTAQVAPQISSAGGTTVRGLLLDGRGVQWNREISVCWRLRPEWLVVDALPPVCIIFRRSALANVGYFNAARSDNPVRFDLDLCRRFAAHGWYSICNQAVTAEFPLDPAAAEFEPAVGPAPVIQVSEERR